MKKRNQQEDKMKMKKMKNLFLGYAALLAALVLFSGCPTDGGESGGGEGPFMISGTITTNEIADLTQASVELYKDDLPEGEAIHSAADGTFSFPGIEKTTKAVYYVKASLAGFTEAETDYFNVTGPVKLPPLTLMSALPQMLSANAPEQDKVIVTFNKPVIISGTAGITLKSHTLVLDEDIAVTAVEKTSDTEWILTSARHFTGAESITVSVAGSTIKEKNGDRYLKAFTQLVTHEWQSSTSITVASTKLIIQTYAVPTLAFLNGAYFYINFDREVGASGINKTAWTLTGSVTGVFGWQGTLTITANDGAVATGRITPIPQEGETLTLSYDHTVHQIDASDGTVMADWSGEVTNIERQVQ